MSTTLLEAAALNLTGSSKQDHLHVSPPLRTPSRCTCPMTLTSWITGQARGIVNIKKELMKKRKLWKY